MIIGVILIVVGFVLIIPGQRTNLILTQHHIDPNHAHWAGVLIVVLGVVCAIIAQAWRHR